MTREAAIEMAARLNEGAPAGVVYEALEGVPRLTAPAGEAFYVRRRRDDAAAVRGAADGGLRPERRDAG